MFLKAYVDIACKAKKDIVALFSVGAARCGEEPMCSLQNKSPPCGLTSATAAV